MHCLDFLFVSGFRGWGCTDGREAETSHEMLVSVVLLVASNIFFVPSIVIALKRRLLCHVVVYTATMVSSMFYHACDQEYYYYCLTRYEVKEDKYKISCSSPGKRLSISALYFLSLKKIPVCIFSLANILFK